MIITFDGKSSNHEDFGNVSILSVGRPIHPGTRDRLLSLPGVDGAIDFGSDRTEGIIPVRFIYEGTSRQDRREKARNLASWVNVKEVRPLTFDDEPGKRYMARPMGHISPRELIIHGFIDVNFVYPSGYAEAVESKTVTSFPAVNEGDEPCPCVITAIMTGAEEGLKITLDETGEYVELNHDLLLDNVVVINILKRKVTVNDIDVREDVTFGSDYFLLPTGNFSLSVEGAASISVEYRELW